MSTSHSSNPTLLLLALTLTAASSTFLAAAHAEGDPHYLPLVPSVKCLNSVRSLLSRCLVQTLHLQTPHYNFPLSTRCCNGLKVATKQCQKDEPLGINIPAFRVLSTFCAAQPPPSPPLVRVPGSSPPQGDEPGASPPQGGESGASPPQAGEPEASSPTVPSPSSTGTVPPPTASPPQGGQSPTLPPSVPPTAGSVQSPASSPSSSSPSTPPLSPAAAPGGISVAPTSAGGASPPASCTHPESASEISKVASPSQSPSPGRPVNPPRKWILEPYHYFYNV